MLESPYTHGDVLRNCVVAFCDQTLKLRTSAADGIKKLKMLKTSFGRFWSLEFHWYFLLLIFWVYNKDQRIHPLLMKNVFMSVESTKPAENWICKVSRYLSIFWNLWFEQKIVATAETWLRITRKWKIYNKCHFPKFNPIFCTWFTLSIMHGWTKKYMCHLCKNQGC